ncbi:MAG: hypothetical protein AMJ46_14255 [Latescibacteria bacterium DG_63]|nr:MAG: hypothetical protein AMJ46_14255 [Latescibacteria bacterium DG_63]
MRKALVIAGLVIAGLSLAAAAGPLSGSWSVGLEFDAFQPVQLSSFESVLEVDYTTCGWTFGTTAVFGKHFFENLLFEAEGAVSGFMFRSILDFVAQTPVFRTWLNAVRFTFAGLNLYGIVMVDNVQTPTNLAIGRGLLLGGSGTVGDCSFEAQAQFNMNDSSYNFYIYGYDWMLDHFVFNRCGTWYKPSGYFDVQSPGCCLCWSGLDIYVEYPFACFDLVTMLSFSCTNGFDQVKFEIDDICLGLPWLSLAWIDIMFTTQAKVVNADFTLVVGQCFCFTPYLALEGAGTLIDGISLKALLVDYSWNGIVFKVGELFDEDGWRPYLTYPGYDVQYAWAWDGTLTSYDECKVPEGYDEFFGVEIDGDSCCGGSFDASLFSWFDTGDSTGIFDWKETRVDLEVGIGSNSTLITSMRLDNNGLHWVKLGYKFVW